MQQDPITTSGLSLRDPLPPRTGLITEALYWYPNELAVTVHAAMPPTLRQLRDLSARLNRLLSRVGISVLPFYSGGHRVSRGGPTREETVVQVTEIEVGSAPTMMHVRAELDMRWKQEVAYCQSVGRFPGVHPFGEGPKGIAVVFYALRTHHRHSGERRDSVQIAVDFINQHLSLLTPRRGETKLPARNDPSRPLDDLLKEINPENPHDVAHQTPLPVLAAMPNWLTAPLPGGAQPPSGPGAPPMEAPPLLQGKWEFQQTPFKHLVQRTKSSKDEVTVIILDTSFAGGKEECKEKAKLLTKPQGNQLLQQVLTDLDTGAITIDTSMTPISDQFRSGLDEYGRPYGYDMVDHGLFVAGIIRGILPDPHQAKIEVIRTQNDYGSGEMDLFLGALYKVSKHPHPDHVVLNLSLGVLPPLEDLPAIWFGSGCCCEGANATTIMQTIDILHLGVRLAIQSLVDKQVVIVAAAGNDSLGKNPAHGPRIPARYEDVLGVAAVDREGEAAGYSNRANTYTWGSGIATYGGEQPNDDSETLAWLARKQKKPAAEPDAVHGLYLYPTFPPLNADETGPKSQNEYGCAWWSGTSFATPVASGLAAHYILAGKRGQGVIKAILNDLAKARAPYEPRLQAPVLEVKEI